jgi:phosphoribosylaminoimidazole-succinocarboxamide synthase
MTDFIDFTRLIDAALTPDQARFWQAVATQAMFNHSN